MGDRVSIGFRQGTNKSVVLFSHWGGEEFVSFAQDYVNNLIKTTPKETINTPLDRFEPNTVMMDFIRYLVYEEFDCGNKPIKSNYHLGKDEHDGDNSDNGHFWIELEEK